MPDNTHTGASAWHPIKTYLLLRPIDPNQGKTLYAPESAAQTEYARAQECAVIDKGPLLGAEYAIGQRVFVAAYKGARVEIDGEELLVVDAETDVLLAHQPPSTAERTTMHNGSPTTFTRLTNLSREPLNIKVFTDHHVVEIFELGGYCVRDLPPNTNFAYDKSRERDLRIDTVT
jgi:co-chaperonin GroES (HSP10)